MQEFMNAVSPGYSKPGHSLLEGRDFHAADVKENNNIVVVNRSSRSILKDKSAVGRHIGADLVPN